MSKSSTAARRLPNREAALEALYSDISAKSMFPFWATSTDVAHDEIKQLMGTQKAVPHRWSYKSDIEPILFRAAERAQVVTTLVSNMPLSRTPTSPYIRTIRVAKGFDGADHRIVEEMQPGDLVITADLPLAAEVVTRGGHALDPRGELYSEDNVRERLAMRNLMQELRSGGELLGGPAPFRQSDRQLFANQLDQFLTRRRDA